MAPTSSSSSSSSSSSASSTSSSCCPPLRGLLLALASLLALLPPAAPARPARHPHPTDVLLSTRRPTTAVQILLDDEAGDDDNDDVTLGSGSGMLVSLSHLDNYLSPVPRPRPSCCSIGRQVGRRGLHCTARLHAARPYPPNGSWPHSASRRMWLLLRRGSRLRVDTADFRFCVIREPFTFEKCCQATRRYQFERRWAHARKWNAAKPSSRQRYIAWRRYQMG